jgi:hypothetical protein
VIVALLAIELTLVMLFLEESHHCRDSPLSLFSALQKWRNRCRHPTQSSRDPSNGELGPDTPLLFNPNDTSQALIPNTSIFGLLSPNLVLIIGTNAINELCAAAYNRLLIVFLSSPLPAGRELSAKEIGYVFSSTSLVGVIIQSLSFTTVERKFGFTACYRASLLFFSFACFYTPFIGVGDGPIGMWTQLVGGLSLGPYANLLASTCSLLLVFFPCSIS